MVVKKKAAVKKASAPERKPQLEPEVKAPVKCFVDGCTSTPPCTKHKWDSG
jgi:hypothetical protein